MSLLEEWSALDDEMASAVIKMIERPRPSGERAGLVAVEEPARA